MLHTAFTLISSSSKGVFGLNIAFICDTSYQILNAMNLLCSMRQQEAVIADLYIGHQFHGSYEIAERIAEGALFDHIYGYRTKTNARGILEKLGRICDIVSPKRALKGQLIQPVDLRSKAYDSIYASMATHFSVSMSYYFPGATLYYFDDGIGSYVHELGESMLSSLNRKIYKLLGKDLNRLSPEAILLNAPSFAAPAISDKVRPLPRLSDAPESLWNLAYRIWDYVPDGYYRRHRMIWMGETNAWGDPRFDEVCNIVTQELSALGCGCLVRPHPRMKDFDPGPFALDDHRQMWELVCSDQITEDHVLISSYSTATVIPKILFDREPRVLFLQQLHDGTIPQHLRHEMQDSVARLKASYRDPSRVLVPRTDEELTAILKELVSLLQ